MVYSLCTALIAPFGHGLPIEILPDTKAFLHYVECVFVLGLGCGAHALIADALDIRGALAATEPGPEQQQRPAEHVFFCGAGRVEGELLRDSHGLWRRAERESIGDCRGAAQPDRQRRDLSQGHDPRGAYRREELAVEEDGDELVCPAGEAAQAAAAVRPVSRAQHVDVF